MTRSGSNETGSPIAAMAALTIAAGPRAGRLRAFMLALLVVDDLVALLVISVVYPRRIDVAAATSPITWAIVLAYLAGRPAARRSRSRRTSRGQGKLLLGLLGPSRRRQQRLNRAKDV